MQGLDLLKQIIDDSGYKLQYIAKILDISYQAFFNKLKGRTFFSNKEIIDLCNLLNIDKETMLKIFFTSLVDET